MKLYIIFDPKNDEGIREVKETFDMDYNLYFNPLQSLDSLRWTDKTWEEWRVSAKDKHSFFADPLFEKGTIKHKYASSIEAPNAIIRAFCVLTNVARASLEELMLDYEDFLRTQKLPIWSKNHWLVSRLRELNRNAHRATYETFKKAIEHENPEICANAMITLINITTYLLNRQIKSLEAAFLKQGGLRERMAKARVEVRKNNSKNGNKNE